jgi:hypothetical protein
MVALKRWPAAVRERRGRNGLPDRGGTRRLHRLPNLLVRLLGENGFN